MSLSDALILYRDSGIYPFHMPGHKRNTFMLNNMFDLGMDITEIDGFDNLHDANGILKKGMEKAALVYGSEHTFYVVNGSTCGIIAGIFACTNKRDKVLVARNCHKSVYNAIKLNELNPVYLLPPIDQEFGINGSITPEYVEEALKNNTDIRLVVVTSPTYEGAVSNIAGIASIAHEYNIPLLVDEAHGAHFGFSDDFPKNSVQLGADIVVHSLHKTLPSPTQTALVHVNGSIVDAGEVQRQLSVFETSSPSYLLLSGIDACIDLLLRQKNSLFEDYKNKLTVFLKKTKQLENIKIAEKTPCFFDFDKGKIVISVKNTNITGAELKNILLEKYLLQLEMAMGDYALAMTSICDTDEGFRRLADALIEIDGKIIKKTNTNYNNKYLTPKIVMPVYEAENSLGIFVSLEESIGKTAREYVYAYPPGVPLLVPGERITNEVLGSIKALVSSGISLKSSFGKMPQAINVVE